MPHDVEILGLKGYEFKDIRSDGDLLSAPGRFLTLS